MKPARASQGQPPLELIEEALAHLRAAPIGTHLAYHLGTAPFVLGLLWFWADMSRGALANRRCATAALLLAGLFLWMKTWQAVFAARFRAFVAAEDSGPWTAGRVIRIAIVQAALQPWGLFALPLTVFPLLSVPTGWVYAFFQNATAGADAAAGRAGDCARSAFRQALRWPGQNHGLLGLLIIAATIVAINVAIALWTLPYLLKLVFAIESDFTLSTAAIFNTTFGLAVLGISYLLLDPLLKAIWVLRCFQGDALTTGDDLRAGLRRQARAGLAGAGTAAGLLLAVAGLVTTPLPAHASEAAPTAPPTVARAGSGLPASDLDRAIEHELRKPDYTWRGRRELPPDEEHLDDDPGDSRLMRWFRQQLKGLRLGLDGFFSGFGNRVERFFKWIFGSGPSNRTLPNLPRGGDQVDWLTGLKIVLYVALAAVAGWLGWLVHRLWRRRRARPADAPAAQVPTAVPDLAAENVSPDQLPEDGWLGLARELAGRGEFRTALRALYLAGLVHLARRELIRLAAFKSNFDYRRELDRRARTLPAVRTAFAETVTTFDRVWYGRHPATPEDFAAAENRLENLRGS